MNGGRKHIREQMRKQMRKTERNAKIWGIDSFFWTIYLELWNLYIVKINVEGKSPLIHAPYSILFWWNKSRKINNKFINCPTWICSWTICLGYYQLISQKLIFHHIMCLECKKNSCTYLIFIILNIVAYWIFTTFFTFLPAY